MHNSLSAKHGNVFSPYNSLFSVVLDDEGHFFKKWSCLSSVIHARHLLIKFALTFSSGIVNLKYCKNANAALSASIVVTFTWRNKSKTSANYLYLSFFSSSATVSIFTLVCLNDSSAKSFLRFMTNQFIFANAVSTLIMILKTDISVIKKLKIQIMNLFRFQLSEKSFPKYFISFKLSSIFFYWLLYDICCFTGR